MQLFINTDVFINKKNIIKINNTSLENNTKYTHAFLRNEIYMDIQFSHY